MALLVGVAGWAGGADGARAASPVGPSARPDAVQTTKPVEARDLAGAMLDGAAGDAGGTGGAGGGAGAAVVHFAPTPLRRAVPGAGVAERFHLARRFELTLQVANALGAESRGTMARVEASVAALPGVRRVIGPSRLLSLRTDATGRVSAAPLFSTPAAPPAVGAASFDLQNELDRRADATGWFVEPDGSAIRLLVDVDERPPGAVAVEAAVASAGLKTTGGEIPRAAVWPDPDRDRLPFEAEWPLRIAMLASLPMLALAIVARARAARFAVGTLALALTMAAPGLASPLGPIRIYALITGSAGAVLAWVAWLLSRIRRRGGRAEATWVSATGVPVTRGRRGRIRGARWAPLPILLGSTALVVAAVMVAPALELRSELSRDTSLFFVHVRADLAEPVVLRELRRFVDRLRSERGVAGAWSIADLFVAIPRAESGVGGIPDDRAVALGILGRASSDGAVEAEVSPDLREGLVVVRFEEESGLDPARVVERITQLATVDLTHSLWRVDVTDPTLTLATRALGRGVLAEGARARVIGLCERAGHTLDDEQRQAIDRTLRRVSLAPVLDAGAYGAAVTREVAAFLEETAIAEHRVAPPQASLRQKLVDAVLGLPGEPSLEDLSRALSDAGGAPKATAAMRENRASELRRRLLAIRRREITRLAAKEILADADLPTEGVLSDAVRDATLEALGPIAGIPAPPRSPGSLTIEAAVVGGAVGDRALAVAWLPRMRQGVLMAAVAEALILLVIGGLRGLTWWPATLAPGAVVLLVPAVAGIPMGLLLVAVLAGALGGGALFGVAASGREARE